MTRLQQQIDQLKLKVFKISQMKQGDQQGLVDSGATHPLRPRRMGESEIDYKKVSVTLANGESTSLQLTPGGTMVTDRMDIEPILPMGHLVHALGCEISWKDGDLRISHPVRGPLPVQHQHVPSAPKGFSTRAY